MKGLFIALFIFLLFIVMGGIGIGVFVYYQTPYAIEYLQRLHPSPTPSPLTIKGVGVIGDSLSDEYRGDDSRGLTYASTTRNWVELLAAKRKIPFGEWGLYEEPRRRGYAYNFARTGENISSALDTGQHTGIAREVEKGNINLVIIYIGVNDFSPLAVDGYEAIYSGRMTEVEVVRKVNRLVADMTTVIDVVQNADPSVRILLVTIPDWGRHSLIQLAFPIPEQRRRVADAINQTNTKLQFLAKEKNIAVAQVAEFYDDLEKRNDAETFKVGKVTMNTYLPGDDPHNLFLDDGVHPGTIYNGLFANFILHELNSQMGVQLLPFSEEELVEAAGL